MVNSQQPPGPRSGALGLQFINSFRTDALATALQLIEEFGDVVYVKAGNFHWFMLNHPDHVKDVLLTRAKLFGKT